MKILLTAIAMLSPVALSLVACAERGSHGTRWQAVIDTVGDTITVRTVSGSVWGDTAHLEPEVSIGMLEGPDEYLIGEPRAVSVGPDGSIYVLDTQVPVLRAYRSDGTHLQDIGRQGGGPGEYESPDGMAAMPDGRVLVRDPGGARIVVFDPTGEYLEQWPLAGGFNTSDPLYVDTRGQVYSLVLCNPGTPPWEWVMGLRRYSSTGEPLDTVPEPTWDYEPPSLTASREGSSSRTSVPFSPDEHWTFSPLGYMVGGLSTEYRIELFRPNAPVIRIEREFEPVAVHPAEAEERRNGTLARFQRQYGSWRWNGPPIPDTKPPFRGMFASGEGNIWVRLSQPGTPTMTEDEAREEEERRGRRPYRYREHPAFDVFAADGRYLGHVTVPASFRVDPEPVISGDHVWAVTRDELDVPRVVRFRIVREPAGQTSS
ncbi:MAG: 6-bladed beta-propeller [Gemmatimonadales bacterium]|jgi:hypothetical protein